MPGSKHRSWNKEWPVLRILMRQDEHPERVHQVRAAGILTWLLRGACGWAAHAQGRVHRTLTSGVWSALVLCSHVGCWCVASS